MRQPRRSWAPVRCVMTLEINDKPQTFVAEPRVTLLDALRDRLHFTGAKKSLRPRHLRRLHRNY